MHISGRKHEAEVVTGVPRRSSNGTLPIDRRSCESERFH